MPTGARPAIRHVSSMRFARVSKDGTARPFGSIKPGDPGVSWPRASLRKGPPHLRQTVSIMRRIAATLVLDGRIFARFQRGANHASSGMRALLRLRHCDMPCQRYPDFESETPRVGKCFSHETLQRKPHFRSPSAIKIQQASLFLLKSPGKMRHTGGSQRFG